MGKRMSRQHEVLRVPNGWTEQDKALVMQLERIHDDLYNRLTKAVTGQVFSVLGITPDDDGNVALTKDSLVGAGVADNESIGLVENGDTASRNIAKGQYVIWNGALYTASVAIASGDTLSGSNLTAVSDGGLNSINSKLELVESLNVTAVKTGSTGFCYRSGKVCMLKVNANGTVSANTDTTIVKVPVCAYGKNLIESPVFSPSQMVVGRARLQTNGNINFYINSATSNPFANFTFIAQDIT